MQILLLSYQIKKILNHIQIGLFYKTFFFTFLTYFIKSFKQKSMKTIKLLVITLCVLAWSNNTSAQYAELNLLSNGGHVFETELINMHFTIGELTTETLQAGNLILTQGFIQPTILSTNINTKKTEEPGITLYPNPATNFIFIEFNNTTGNSYKIELININGKKVLEIQNTEKVNKIDLTPLNSGTFLVKVTNHINQTSKTKLIQKIK